MIGCVRCVRGSGARGGQDCRVGRGTSESDTEGQVGGGDKMAAPVTIGGQDGCLHRVISYSAIGGQDVCLHRVISYSAIAVFYIYLTLPTIYSVSI